MGTASLIMTCMYCENGLHQVSLSRIPTTIPRHFHCIKQPARNVNQNTMSVYFEYFYCVLGMVGYRRAGRASTTTALKVCLPLIRRW